MIDGEGVNRAAMALSNFSAGDRKGTRRAELESLRRAASRDIFEKLMKSVRSRMAGGLIESITAIPDSRPVSAQRCSRIKNMQIYLNV